MKTYAGFALVLAAVLASATASARGLYADGFDPPFIAPQFPLVAGEFQLPPGPTTDQLQWLIGELAAGETTTIAEINAHFDPSWLNQIPATEIQTFINSIRSAHPDAMITDVVAVSPVRVTVLIDSPGSPLPAGFLTMGARYTGTQRIVQLGVSNYGGTVQYPADQNLTMTQAADRFATLSSAPALLVGRIGSNNQCTSIVERNGAQLRATASIFKIWVLGGVARAVAGGAVATADEIPMVASELAQGGIINIEPINTLFPVGELATMMMGNSDNTATDLLHELVGRELIGDFIGSSGVAQPEVLAPLLGISEQFHLFYSFPLDESLSYINGTEAFQEQFIAEEIEPLGPLGAGPHDFFHVSLLTADTWRASPFDICSTFAALRRLPPGSEALQMVDAALGSQASQPDVRNEWDRVWYKGGSLLASTNNYHVLTHAWMLENAGEDPYVVIAMSNSSSGGIDQFNVQSITGRLLELVSQLP